MFNKKNSPNDSIVEKYTIGHKVETPPRAKIVLVGGCFDILHSGHMEFLRESKNAGDYLIIALEPDERIFSKKRPPTHNQFQRAQNLSAIRYVDKILLLGKMKGFEDYTQLVFDVRPNVIATTEGDPQIHNKKKQAQAVGASIMVVVERDKSFSSSAIYKNNQ